jgi:poly(3-hydroxybutyrate) depolymerase
MFGLDHVGFIFAQAPDPYSDGWSWFTIDLGRGADVDGVRRSRARLGQLIDDLLIELAIGSDRLALMGFSQGCLMVLDQAWHGARTFAGVVGISGLVADTEGFPGTFAAAADPVDPWPVRPRDPAGLDPSQHASAALPRADDGLAGISERPWTRPGTRAGRHRCVLAGLPAALNTHTAAPSHRERPGAAMSRQYNKVEKRRRAQRRTKRNAIKLKELLAKPSRKKAVDAKPAAAEIKPAESG